MNIAVEVTVAIFLAGIIFAGGRLTARVEELERWRLDMLNRLDRLDSKMDRILELLRVRNP